MKINVKDAAKMARALNLVNGSATSHTFRYASDVTWDVVGMVENELESLGLRKAEWKGAKALATSPGPSSASRYSSIGTRVELMRGHGDWFMIGAWRINVWPGTVSRRPTVRLGLTYRQSALASERFSERFEVLDGPPLSGNGEWQ